MKKLLLAIIVAISAVPSFGQWSKTIPDTTDFVNLFEISYADNNYCCVTGGYNDCFYTTDAGSYWINVDWNFPVIKFYDQYTGRHVFLRGKYGQWCDGSKDNCKLRCQPITSLPVHVGLIWDSIFVSKYKHDGAVQ